MPEGMRTYFFHYPGSGCEILDNSEYHCPRKPASTPVKEHYIRILYHRKPVPVCHVYIYFFQGFTAYRDQPLFITFPCDNYKFIRIMYVGESKVDQLGDP